MDAWIRLPIHTGKLRHWFCRNTFRFFYHDLLNDKQAVVTLTADKKQLEETVTTLIAENKKLKKELEDLKFSGNT